MGALEEAAQHFFFRVVARTENLSWSLLGERQQMYLQGEEDHMLLTNNFFNPQEEEALGGHI